MTFALNSVWLWWFPSVRRFVLCCSRQHPPQPYHTKGNLTASQAMQGRTPGRPEGRRRAVASRCKPTRVRGKAHGARQPVVFTAAARTRILPVLCVASAGPQQEPEGHGGDGEEVAVAIGPPERPPQAVPAQGKEPDEQATQHEQAGDAPIVTAEQPPSKKQRTGLSFGEEDP